MKMKLLIPVLALFPTLVAAENAPTWVDKQHTKVSDTLDNWANNINDWLGEPDPNQPATASLRFILDSQWNRYDKLSYKPRVRGKIKLPVLKQRLNIVFGDDELDNELQDKNRTNDLYKKVEKDKRYNAQEARNSNSSIALRWSDSIKSLGINTDLDGGVRSGSDFYGRFRIGKTWQLSEQFSTHLEQIYRYGTESKHYLRTNFENKYRENESTFIMNHTHFEYRHDVDEEKSWGNSLYRQHNVKPLANLSYGIAIGGMIGKELAKFNHWGPFVSYRQPIWRKWIFIQPELNYYNNRNLQRTHSIGAFLRVEAIF